MIEQTFNKVLSVGDLEFTATGVYIESDEIEVVFETVTVEVEHDHEMITIDAELIISALNSWNLLDELIIGEFKEDDGSDLNIDNITEEEILSDD